MPRSFDIFCRVVDNYGDIGVCWRLARRLTSQPGNGRIRLWVDDLAAFSRIAPAVQPGIASQTLHDVEIRRWPDTLPSEPADVIIEAFACTPPGEYTARITPRQISINLEYLSAEGWVESCHGLPSLQAGGLRKFFFFPGFTARTGGLLREPGLLARRNAWQAEPEARLALLTRLGVTTPWLRRLRDEARLVYLFCYPEAPLPALMASLGAAGRDTLVLAPQGIWPHDLPRVTEAHGQRVEVHSHPFVDQDTFDQLLWSADLNIVRGEDSLVRATWAGRPMIWQAYRQQDETHLDKLEAWLARTPYDINVREAMQAWNRCDDATLAERLPRLLQAPSLAAWRDQAQAWCATLADGKDLADRLSDFCTEQAQTR